MKNLPIGDIAISKKTLRILCLFDYNAHTGFATVSTNIIREIKKIFGNTDQYAGILLDICAINYFGERDKDGKITKTYYQEDKATVVFSALFSVPLKSTPEAKDDFGRNGFLWILKHSNDEDENDATPRGYNGIFIIQDAPVINDIVPLLEIIKKENQEKNLPNFKSIFYFPADFEMVDQVLDKLGFFDLLITYNEYSRNAVLKWRPEFKPKLKVIPHGIDLKQFYPIDNQAQIDDFRKEYFGNNADKFIVLNLNRNQPRKDIPCTVFGFKEYQKENPNAFLYLHMNPRDPKGWDMRLLMMQVGLREGIDYMFPPVDKENHGHTTAELNLIYNACDVYVTTTKGEGWGLGVTEAMACRLPVICPMHTSFTEIGDYGRRVYPLENLYPICTVDDNIVREQCDYLEVAEKLKEAELDIKTNNPNLTKKLDMALSYVQSLHWPGIAQQFAEYFKQVF